MAQRSQNKKGSSGLILQHHICLFDVYTTAFFLAAGIDLFLSQPVTNASCIILGRRTVFVYCQQNWQRQLAHTKTSKYVLEPQKRQQLLIIQGREGGRKGDVLIVGGTFKELGNAAFGHLYMITFFVSLSLVVFFFFSFCFFLFSIGTGFTEKKHTADWSALGVGGFPPRMVVFYTEGNTIFFSLFKPFFLACYYFLASFCFFPRLHQVYRRGPHSLFLSKNTDTRW